MLPSVFLLVGAVSAAVASATASLPSSFTWSSSGPLVGAKNDGRGIAGIKDPSIVNIDGTYHVFASTASDAGYSLVYFNFKDFSKAGSATFHYLDQTPIGTGYRAAPEVFYFAPKKLWYLIYQNGNAAYSTNTDINNPAGWSAPTNFYPSIPKIINDNLPGGGWVDMWVICDTKNCYLFSSDDNGHLYRSSTTLANFPSGMSDPVIHMQTTNKYDLYEASCMYNVGGKYFLIVECIGSTGYRYFRSWTSKTITGAWTPLAATEANPFAGMNDVSFSGTPWTKDISHGEAVRTIVDQTLSLDPCHIRFLYQGKDPSVTNTTYNGLPWKLALLTQTNKGSGC